MQWWISPLEFYVMPKSKETELTNLMKLIQRFYRNKATIYDNPAIGSYVIARNQQDQKLYRARVLAYNEKLNKFRVCLIDLGKKSVVTLDDIWEMEKRFAKLPVIVVPCTMDKILLNLSVKEFESKIDDYIRSDSNIDCKLLSLLPNEFYDVDLVVDGQNLRQQLLDCGAISMLPTSKCLYLLV